MSEYNELFWFNAALEYARKINNDTVRKAGAKNGWHYYHIFRMSDKGHKKGWPHIVKVNEEGQCITVEDLTERMWAVRQELLTNKL